MKQLSEFIQSKVKIPEDDLQVILSQFSEQTIEKEQFLIRKGQLVTHYYFVQSGGLRIYSDNDDKQITGWLAFENDFFTELKGMKSTLPTEFYIQAIETSTVLKIQRNQMDALYEQFPSWQAFGRQIWEEAFLKVINGIISYQTLTAEERYLNLMNQSNLLQKVPLKQLASYLGITPTSLSRIRKNIR